jgi:hypothetical protein
MEDKKIIDLKKEKKKKGKNHILEVQDGKLGGKGSVGGGRDN